LLTGDARGTLKVWDTSNWQEVRSVGDWICISAIKISPDSQYAAVAEYGGIISVVSIDTMETIVRLEGHAGTVQDMTFSSDGELLASGGDDAAIRLWRWKYGICELFYPVAGAITHCVLTN